MRIIIFIMSMTRCSRVNREHFRVIDSAQLLYADSFKAICLPQPLLSSLPLSSLPLTASAEKIPSSGIRNFTDITVEQMASVHPPLSIPFDMLFYSSCRFLSRSHTHSQTSFMVFRFMISLFLSLFLRPPLLSSCILPHSPFPFIPRA